MVGPMMPIGGQMPMGRGRMPAMIGPMRPPFPPRFMPHEMFSPGLRPTPSELHWKQKKTIKNRYIA